MIDSTHLKIDSIPSTNPQNRDKISPRSHFRIHALKQIPQQAMDVKSGLVKTKKVAGEIIEEAPALSSRGRSANHVFAIGDTASPLGFLKIGKQGISASAIMERMVWEIASLFQVQDLFVPTTEMEISQERAKKLSVEVVDIDTSQQKRYKRCSLDSLSNSSKFLGSFQIAEKGKPLVEVLQIGLPLTSINPNASEVMNNLIQAVVASLGFGMMDAHSNNIFVTKEANYKFIDNARTFPHSNGVYAGCGTISSSYRCGLLELPECHMPLKEFQKRYMIEVIEKFKNKLPDFEEFLKTALVQKRIAELPVGWFDTDKVIRTTRERIEMLHIAALSENTKSLVDLVCETVPYYRLFSISYILFKNLNGQIFDESHWRIATARASLITLSDLLSISNKYNLNPYTLLGLAMQRNFSYAACYDELNNMLCYVKFVLSRETLMNFASLFYAIANIDLKDINQSYVNEGLRLYMEESLLLADILIDKKNDNQPYIVEIDNEPFRLIIKMNENKSKIYHLDIFSLPGKIKIVELPDLAPQKISEFKDWIEDQVIL